MSWKTAETLWIKASGCWLADAARKDIFVPVDRHQLSAAIADRSYNVNPQVKIESPLRPSIETLLHAVMPHKFVIHLHPVDILAHLIRCNCEDTLRTALDGVFEWGIVNYHKPGPELANAAHLELEKKPETNLLFLKNHGVILGAEKLETIENILQILSQRLKIEPGRVNRPERKNSDTKLPNLGGTAYRMCSNPELNALTSDQDLYERLIDNWAICPDHVVFLGAEPVCIRNPQNLQHTLKAHDSPPPFVFVKNMGVLQNRKTTPAQIAQLTFYLDVMTRQIHGEKLAILKQTQISELLNWDAEKYRISINTR